MATPTSQYSAVSFGGVSIGSLTGWRAIAGTAQFEETTNVNSQVVGVGGNARVVKTYDCVAIEPGGVDVTLFGCPPFFAVEIGSRGTLTVAFEGGGISFDAYLETFDVSASVGEFLVGTARFRFSGE